MKHIDVKYQFLREAVNTGVVKLVYVSTENQIADLLTKPLPRATLKKLLFAIGIII